MQMRPQSWVLLGAFVVLGAGCVTTTANEDPRTARLPTGVTLLDSDRNRCAGAVTIDERSIASARRSDLVIQRGQNATFTVDADDRDDVEIEWTCVGSANADRETAECPDATSHVRITRDATDDGFLLECYGDRSRTTRR